jgi:hypothetical protein
MVRSLLKECVTFWRASLPGCNVESTIFFACHSSGDMVGIVPSLYRVIRFFAFSRLAFDVNNVLRVSISMRAKFSRKRTVAVPPEPNTLHCRPQSFETMKFYNRSRASHLTLRLPYLGSEMSAECLTRPQYVLKSYLEAGISRLPGNEDDIVMPLLTEDSLPNGSC